MTAQALSFKGQYKPVNTPSHTQTTCKPSPLSLLFDLKPVPVLFASATLAFCSISLTPFPPKASFKEDTHRFITLMNLVGFSRRSCPPGMQRQMPPVPRQLLLMFKVMQEDRLIKRRLRDALGPSLSHHEGLVTSRSRMLLPRHRAKRMETVPQEHYLSIHAHTHTQAHTYFSLSLPCPHCSAGFTIVQVYTERRLGHVLIKPDITQ